MIDENKITILKTKINTLGNVLKKCEFDKARLEVMFSKKILQRNIFMLHMLTHLNHNTFIHISMLIPYILIILLYMEFIHALIVAERVT